MSKADLTPTTYYGTSAVTKRLRELGFQNVTASKLRRWIHGKHLEASQPKGKSTAWQIQGRAVIALVAKLKRGDLR